LDYSIRGSLAPSISLNFMVRLAGEVPSSRNNGPKQTQANKNQCCEDGLDRLSGDTGGDSFSLTLQPPSPLLIAPPLELAPRRYPRGLAMRVAAGLSFPSCGAAMYGGESSAELMMEAG
jgi:hypothetical protein